MGLDVTHDCWHGAYSRFDRYRTALAAAAGFPPLGTMAGFCEGRGQSWEPYEADPLTVLLSHSDCDGLIAHAACAPLADRLEELLPRIVDVDDSNDWRRRTKQFIKGLREAHKAGEDVEFR